jgi:hypothetical protein
MHHPNWHTDNLSNRPALDAQWMQQPVLRQLIFVDLLPRLLTGFHLNVAAQRFCTCQRRKQTAVNYQGWSHISKS